MSLDLTTPPALEPVTLAEAKAHLRLDTDAEDALVASLITASRLQLERALALALVTQGWTWRLDRWPPAGRWLEVPLGPVAAVTAITVTDGQGGMQSLAPESLILEGTARPPRLVPAASPLPVPGVPAQGIAIAFTAGFGPAAGDVPAPLRQAILLLIAHWHEGRAPHDLPPATAPLPPAAAALAAGFTTVRL